MADVHKINVYEDIEPMKFPDFKRETRVFVGNQSPLQSTQYVVGTADIQPGGGVMGHKHETEETYWILSGTGIMTIEDEDVPVKPGDSIYLPPWQFHELKNTGDTVMRTLFVYAPVMIVDHWAEEAKGGHTL